MTCRYCRAQNSEGEHRCQRCGRRLDDQPVRYAYAHGSTAPVLEARADQAPEQSPRSKPEFVAVPGGATEPRQRAWQPSLFGTRGLGQVVSLDALSGVRTERPRRGRAETTSRPRTRKPNPSQQDLQFAEAPAATPRPHSTAPAPTGVIWCDAPVAIAAHRLVAAAMDLLLVGLAVALFTLMVLVLPGGMAAIHGVSWVMLAAITGVFYLFYESLWCLANADTLGMRWSQLRTVTFDGRPLDREQRLSRMAAQCLSVTAVGLGLLWSLVDEESLTWHDHISRTFPTPYRD